MCLQRYLQITSFLDATGCLSGAAPVEDVLVQVQTARSVNTYKRTTNQLQTCPQTTRRGESRGGIASKQRCKLLSEYLLHVVPVGSAAVLPALGAKPCNCSR